MNAFALRRVAATVVALAVVPAVLLMSPGAASAHDELVTSTPANGAIVKAVPHSVVLNFEEPPVAGYTKVRITGPSGIDLSAGTPVTVGPRVTLNVRSSTALGPYAIRWSLLSDDGHPVSGVIRFTVAAATSPSATATPHVAHTSAAGSTWIVPGLIGIGALVALFGVSRVAGHRRAGSAH